MNTAERKIDQPKIELLLSVWFTSVLELRSSSPQTREKLSRVSSRPLVIDLIDSHLQGKHSDNLLENVSEMSGITVSYNADLQEFTLIR